MEQSDIKEYVTLCRLLGPWTDWVQGPGGNISVKSWDATRMIVKRSGALLANTTTTEGWVVCDLGKVKAALDAGTESIEHTVLQGTGKPSIETFLHCLDARIVVHLHPAPLLPLLCQTKVEFIPYMKPGIPLAKEILKRTPLDQKPHAMYCLANHGVLLTGNNISDILQSLFTLDKFFQPTPMLPQTHAVFVSNLFFALKSLTGKEYLIQPVGFYGFPIIRPYTPDIAVFVQTAIMGSSSTMTDILKRLTHQVQPSVVFTETMSYVVGTTLEQCRSIHEILLSALAAGSAPNTLTDDQVRELCSWDKEKERRQ